MICSPIPQSLEEVIRDRSTVLRHEYQRALWKNTDRVFALLLAIQWIAGIILAVCLSPWAWEGLNRHIHPHVWIAVGLGGLVAALPIGLALRRPGETSTRMIVAIAQMLHSALLIHLLGGRIETHFHVFGSLAFLSFYRDWRVLVPATIVIAADHALRGLFWPESVFGVLYVNPWRWMEHAAWVGFEDIFLIWACLRGARELTLLASRQAELETINQRVEAEVARKTAQLQTVTHELITTARRAGMADVATGVLHNVGNVLNSVNVATNVVARKLRESEVASLVRAGQLLQDNQATMASFLTTDERGKLLPGFLIDLAAHLNQEQAQLLSEVQRLERGVDHIKQIVDAQQQHARAGTLRETVAPADIFEQALAIDLGPSSHRAAQIVRDFAPVPPCAMDKHKVLQILINLLTNARHAVQTGQTANPRITLQIKAGRDPAGDRLLLGVNDNGIGIEPGNLSRIFARGFTTRSEGHGLGLHSAANAAAEMGGSLTVSSDGIGRGSTFTLEIPLAAQTTSEELITRKRMPS